MKIRTLRVIQVVAISIIFASCDGKKEKKENVYENHGISFTIPDGWKVTDDSDVPGKGTVINCEKMGADESGLASIAIVDTTNDIQNMLISTMLETKSSFSNMGGTFETEKPTNGKFNGYESVSAPYKAVVQDVPHTGMVYAFSGCNKRILLVLQEANEDHIENAPGMEVLKNSIKCVE